MSFELTNTHETNGFPLRTSVEGPASGPAGGNKANRSDTDPATRENRQGVGSLEQSVEELKNHFQQVRRSLDFSIDDKTGQTVVKVIDRETDEVIRQIPAEEILAVMRRIEEYSESQGQGLFLLETV